MEELESSVETRDRKLKSIICGGKACKLNLKLARFQSERGRQSKALFFVQAAVRRGRERGWIVVMWHQLGWSSFIFRGTFSLVLAPN